jgi:hypothetical protein
MDIYVLLSYKDKKIIPDSSVNEVTGCKAQILLTIHKRTFLFDTKKSLGFLNGTAIPGQAQRVPRGCGFQISRGCQPYAPAAFTVTHFC